MRMLVTAGALDITGWLRGLLSAGISSSAGAVASGFGPMVVDPKDFNFSNPSLMLKTAAIGAAFSGIVSMAKFLSTQPLPAVKEVTTTVQTVTSDSAPTKVIETVQEKHIEPIDPKAKGPSDGGQ